MHIEVGKRYVIKNVRQIEPHAPSSCLHGRAFHVRQISETGIFAYGYIVGLQSGTMNHVVEVANLGDELPFNEEK